jgi:hypothetical protein
MVADMKAIWAAEQLAKKRAEALARMNENVTPRKAKKNGK